MKLHYLMLVTLEFLIWHTLPKTATLDKLMNNGTNNLSMTTIVLQNFSNAQYTLSPDTQITS